MTSQPIPTAGQIDAEMSRGCDYPTAVRRVTARLTAELERVFAVSPEADLEVAEAQQAAAAAQEKANLAVSKRQRAIADLEARIRRLGALRHRLALVKGLEHSATTIDQVSEQMLEAYFINAEDPTFANRTTLQNQVTVLSEIIMSQRFLPAYSSKLSAQADALAEEIRATAQAEKLKLRLVLAAIRQAAYFQQANCIDRHEIKDPVFLQYERAHYFDDL